MDRQTTMWANAKGFRAINKDTMVGMIERIPVTLRIDGQNTVFLFSVEADAAQLASLSTRMTEYGAELGGTLQVMTEGGKVVLVRGGAALLNQQGLDRLLLMFLQETRTLGIQPRTTCEICGRPAESVVAADARATTVCASCKDSAKKNVKKGNPITGFIGAFLGAAVGAVPWIVCITVLNFYLGYLAILIGACSFIGYRLLGGSRKKGFAIFSVVLSTLLAVLASEVVSIAIQEEIPLMLTALLYMKAVVNLDFVILANTAFALVFSAIGISYAVRKIKTYIFADSMEVIAPVSGPAAYAQPVIQPTAPQLENPEQNTKNQG